ncbi:MAG TPA: crossover junction endodeoxyribonuclease RuvC [Thermodesulfobacteriota bacterium]|nr:crossover junction endodeoxyribonuclease RuvC [Thermodesulfobacteriota bacterium]
MGVDPGMGGTGFGIIEVTSTGALQYRESGVILPRGSVVAHRIQKIFHDLIRVIDRFQPERMAVERPFFGKNVKSAMILGEARGAAILAAAERGVIVQEYSPLEVKQAVVGYGRAAKEQIQTMVGAILRAPQPLKSHAADALAVAVCLAHSLAWQLEVEKAGAVRTTRGNGRRHFCGGTP